MFKPKFIAFVEAMLSRSVVLPASPKSGHGASESSPSPPGLICAPEPSPKSGHGVSEPSPYSMVDASVYIIIIFLLFLSFVDIVLCDWRVFGFELLFALCFYFLLFLSLPRWMP